MAVAEPRPELPALLLRCRTHRCHVALVSVTPDCGAHKVINPATLRCPVCDGPLDFRVWVELVYLTPAEVEPPCARPHG